MKALTWLVAFGVASLMAIRGHGSAEVAGFGIQALLWWLFARSGRRSRS